MKAAVLPSFLPAKRLRQSAKLPLSIRRRRAYPRTYITCLSYQLFNSRNCLKAVTVGCFAADFEYITGVETALSETTLQYYRPLKPCG